MKLMSWIRFRVRRERAMMSIIVLGSVAWALEGTMAARMNARKIFRHEKNLLEDDILE